MPDSIAEALAENMARRAARQELVAALQELERQLRQLPPLEALQRTIAAVKGMR